MLKIDLEIMKHNARVAALGHTDAGKVRYCATNYFFEQCEYMDEKGELHIFEKRLSDGMNYQILLDKGLSKTEVQDAFLRRCPDLSRFNRR